MAHRRKDSGAVGEGAVSKRRGVVNRPLFYKQLVGKRLYINSQVRFLVAGGIVVGTLAAKYILGIEGLDSTSLVLLAGLLGLFNVGVFLVARRHRDLERRGPICRFLMGMMHLTIAVDFLFLTVALWLVGGVKSPFRAFYLLQVILAAAFLSPRAASLHALFGYTLLSGLVLGQWWGVIPIHFPVGAVNSAQPLDGRYVLTILFVQGMLMALAIYLLAGLTKLLRRGEHELRSANAQLERVSNLQRNFLHIALHDLKSPVSAATMLIQSMKIASDPPLSGQQAQRVERVRIRLNEAMAFLHDLSILAALDSADIEKHAKKIRTAALVRGAVAETQDMAAERSHSVSVEVAEDLPPLHGVDRLIHEAVVNLITNAIKYTPDNGTIMVRARHENGGIRIEVEDNGVGIAPEDQELLFQEFVRIKRKDSAAGKTPGSGLGLSIVRRIIEAHGGTVGVTSDIDKGSTFFIELPVETADTTAST